MTATRRRVHSLTTRALKGGAAWVSVKSGRTRYHLMVGQDTKLVGLFSETQAKGLRHIDAETVTLNSETIPQWYDTPGRRQFLASPLISTREWTR